MLLSTVANRLGALLTMLLTSLALGACSSVLPPELYKPGFGHVDTVFKETINALNQNSADWQRVLQQAQNELTEDAQATIRNEIQTLVTRSTSHAATEFACRTRYLISELQRILDGYLGKPVPPLDAVVCTPDPPTVERARADLSYLAFNGYNFDKEPFRVCVEEAGECLPVPAAAVASPTHYLITVKLTRGNDPAAARLTINSTRIILTLGSNPDKAKTHTVSIIQPPCKTDKFELKNLKVNYEPPLAAGDREFNGHGPFVYAQTRLVPSRDKLEAETYIRAIETRDDWSRGEGTSRDTLYKPPPGWRIDSVGAVRFEQRHYLDDTVAPDVFLGSALVREWRFVGDRDGPDLDHGTSIDLTFQPIAITIAETQDCVPGAEAPELPKSLPLCDWRNTITGAGSRVCPIGFAARGLECANGNCNDIGFLCCPYSVNELDPEAHRAWSGNIGSVSQSPTFSVTQVVSGVRCKDENCRTVNVQMLSSPALGSTVEAECRWSNWFSGVGRGHAICEEDELVSSVDCSINCKKMRVRCCPYASSGP